MSRKTKKARADAHRSPVRADSCLSGFWSMPCDSIPAAPFSVLWPFAALPQRPGLADPPRRSASPNCLRVFADSPVGKKSRTEGGPRYFWQRRKLQLPGGRAARNPAGAGLGFRVPKRPPISSAISAAEAICFCSFPPQSCGCGSGDKGSVGCLRR